MFFHQWQIKPSESTGMTLEGPRLQVLKTAGTIPWALIV